MRTREDITQTMERHSDTVLRVCTVYFPRRAEREDAFQETFLRYLQSETEFADEEHRKAWLIRVAANICKDMIKRADAKALPVDCTDEAARPLWQQPDSSGEELAVPGELPSCVSKALEQLDDKYRIVLHLMYYEGYAAREIASIIGVPENTVYTNLARGRKKLKEVLTDEKRREDCSGSFGYAVAG